MSPQHGTSTIANRRWHHEQKNSTAKVGGRESAPVQNRQAEKLISDIKGRYDVLTRCRVCFHNFLLQKSPSRIFGQNSGNSVDISKAFFEMVIWKFESSQAASQSLS
jgi:hypothetical protein